MRKVLIVCGLLATISSSASAQFMWDSPTFASPRPMDDIGVYVTRADEATGLVGIWRQSGNLNLGVKAGVADLDNAGASLLVGAELFGPLNTLLPGSGLELAWTLGGGAVFGDNVTTASIPFGLSAGVQLGSGSVSILPYVHPRVSLDIVSFDFGGEEETETDGSFAIDLGADVTLSERLLIRVAGSFADRESFGVGLAYRIPRPISVR